MRIDICIKFTYSQAYKCQDKDEDAQLFIYMTVNLHMNLNISTNRKVDLQAADVSNLALTFNTDRAVTSTTTDAQASDKPLPKPNNIMGLKGI